MNYLRILLFTFSFAITSVYAGISAWSVYTRPDAITALTQWNHDYIVGTTSKGVVTFRKSQNCVTVQSNKTNGLPQTITQLFADADSSLWIAGNNGYCIFKNDTCIKDPYVNSISKLFRDNSGLLCFLGSSTRSVSSGIHYKMDSGWVSFRKDWRSSQGAYKAAFDNNNVVYALYVDYTYSGKPVVSLRKGIAGPNCGTGDPLRDTLVVISDSIHCSSLAFDTAGLLWLGTDSSQLCCLREGKIRIDSLKTALLHGRRVFSLDFDKLNRMWIVSDSALLCLGDTSIQSFDKSSLPLLRDYYWKFKGTTQSALTLNVEPALTRNDSGYLSFAVGEKIAWYDDSKWNVLTPDSFGMMPLSSFTFFGMDSKDTGWIVGNTLRSVYKLYDGKFIPCNWDTTGLSGSINNFLIDQSDHLWFSIYTGKIVKFDRATRKVIQSPVSSYSPTRFFNDEENNFWVVASPSGSSATLLYKMQGDSLNLRYSKTTIPMLENQVTAFACLPRGGAVLGTTAGNIGMIKNDTFHMYSRLKYQLPSSAVTVLYPGKDNSFWIGSGSFLIKFDDGIKQTFTYGKPGGLPLPSVTAALPRDDGNVWLMGSNNLVLFDNTSDWDLAAPQHKFPYATTNSNFSALRSMCRDSHGAIWMECGDALIKYTPSPMIHVDARRMRCTDKEGSAVDRIVFQKPTGFSTRVTLAGPADVTVQSFLVNGKRIGESKSTFAQAGDYFLSIPFRKKSDILHNVVIVKVRIVAK